MKNVLHKCWLGVALLSALSVQAQLADHEQATRRGDEALREALGERAAIAADPTIFIKGAAMGGLVVVELSKLAGTNAQGDRLKDFARQLRQDQENINAGLSQVAARKGFDVPDTLSGQDEILVSEAAQKFELEFDAWYTARIQAELARAVALFEAATDIPDAELADFAAKRLPVLLAQQDRARALE